MLNHPVFKPHGIKYKQKHEKKIQRNSIANSDLKSLMQLSQINKKVLQSNVYELVSDFQEEPKFVQIKY